MHPILIPAPPSKSLSHRFLIAAALAKGESHLNTVLDCDDTARTCEILTGLGARFTHHAHSITVHGITEKASPSQSVHSCFVGESGTTCRLLTAILAARQGQFRVHGAQRMHERPIKALTDALIQLGAQITFEQENGNPPFLLNAHGLDASSLPDATVHINCDTSSQYLSGLLLAAPLGKGLCIELAGNRVVSWPYVSLTLETLERFGIPFQVFTRTSGTWQPQAWRTLTQAEPGNIRFSIEKAPYHAGTYTVEGDWSSSSYFLAAGAIGPHPVTVQGLDQNSLQADRALLAIIEEMGGIVRREATGITILPSPLHGIEIDMGHCPDLVPTVATLATHAVGATIIRGVAHAQTKESNRLHAPAQELAKLGAVVIVTTDGMVVAPPPMGLTPPKADTVFCTHNDHRMAMSLSLLGLPGMRGKTGFPIVLDNPDCVTKSFPQFWQLWQKVQG